MLILKLTDLKTLIRKRFWNNGPFTNLPSSGRAFRNLIPANHVPLATGQLLPGKCAGFLYAIPHHVYNNPGRHSSLQ